MTLALIGVIVIGFNTLDKGRSSFPDSYHYDGIDQKYPNMLYQFQDKVKQAGYLELYNHHVLKIGEEEALYNWYRQCHFKFDLIVKWLKKNLTQFYQCNNYYWKQYLIIQQKRVCI